jgi:hypothetical protein
MRILENRAIKYNAKDITNVKFQISAIKITLINLLIIVCSAAFSQQIKYISGNVCDSKTLQPIAYAVIYNPTNGAGTITNTEGLFSIAISNQKDSIRITYIGYNEQWIQAHAAGAITKILLKESVTLLNEITIRPDDNDYLYDLIQACGKNTSNKTSNGKALYELKSYVANKQVELVECYYNIETNGSRVSRLDLKTGRIALQPFYDRFYASLESSRAIVMLNPLKQHDYFPANPFHYGPSKLKKKYYLSLDQKFLDAFEDTIYVIDYSPKEKTGKDFHGKIWINQKNKQLVKITMLCEHAALHPFLPLHSTDKISDVGFNITCTYDVLDGQPQFNHIDFVYNILYESRTGKPEELITEVQTNAVLHVYDQKQLFFKPLFDQEFNLRGDYRAINAMPYNEMFWLNNQEFKLNSNVSSNETYFHDENSLNSKSLFAKNDFWNTGIFEHGYVSWSPKRIAFREISLDTTSKNKSGIIAEQFELHIGIYLDINPIGDSLDLITAAIFDPYRTYYHLPIDKRTTCFLNMYFDWCEIQKRELEQQVQPIKSNNQEVIKIYHRFMEKYETENRKFLLETSRGTNKEAMERYNKIIYSRIGINNLELFQPYSDEQKTD